LYGQWLWPRQRIRYTAPADQHLMAPSRQVHRRPYITCNERHPTLARDHDTQWLACITVYAINLHIVAIVCDRRRQRHQMLNFFHAVAKVPWGSACYSPVAGPWIEWSAAHCVLSVITGILRLPKGGGGKRLRRRLGRMSSSGEVVCRQ